MGASQSAPVPAADAAIGPLDELPDFLLGRVFAAAGRDAGPTLTAVCRRWRQIYFSEPALWRTWTLQTRHLKYMLPLLRESWLATNLAVLHRVAPLVRDANLWLGSGLPPFFLEQEDSMDSGSDDSEDASLSLGCFLLELPPTLCALRLHCAARDAPAPKALPEALARFPQLTRLVLLSRELPGGLEPAIRSLRELQHLELEAAHIPEAVVASVASQLAGLTNLRLVSDSPWSSLPNAAISALTALTELRHLHLIEEADGEGRLAMPAPSAFPFLRAFEFETLERSFELGGRELRRCAFTLPRGQGQGQGQGQGVLELEDAQGEGPLQALLEALLPPGLGPDAPFGLALEGMSLTVAQSANCPLLGRMTRLQLTDLDGSTQQRGWLPALLSELVEQAPGLTELALVDCMDAHGEEEHEEGEGEEEALGGIPLALPDCLLSKTGLQRLALSFMCLTELPEGPYLAGLRSLDLSDNNFDRLPPAVAAATQLTCLDVQGNHRLALSRDDVDGILLQLPHLSKLRFGSYTDPARGTRAALHHLERRAPQLRILLPEDSDSEADQGDWGHGRWHQLEGEEGGFYQPSSGSGSDYGDGEWEEDYEEEDMDVGWGEGEEEDDDDGDDEEGMEAGWEVHEGVEVGWVEGEVDEDEDDSEVEGGDGGSTTSGSAD